MWAKRGVDWGGGLVPWAAASSSGIRERPSGSIREGSWNGGERRKGMEDGIKRLEDKSNNRVGNNESTEAGPPLYLDWRTQLAH